MKSKIKKYFLSLMFDSQNRKIVKKKKLSIPRYIISGHQELQFFSFGKKNDDKIFYVIQRKIGGGLFSNLLYVLNHLVISEKFNFIPVIFKNATLPTGNLASNIRSRVSKSFTAVPVIARLPANPAKFGASMLRVITLS
mgnify:CR=1 FL=1